MEHLQRPDGARLLVGEVLQFDELLLATPRRDELVLEALELRLVRLELLVRLGELVLRVHCTRTEQHITLYCTALFIVLCSCSCSCSSSTL